uniref:protein-serine/threonine phosphatase n=1 Tax=Opuntia streptacantha TaxID=393608 RepID=A0A7C9EUN9_OPUST
MGTYLSKPKTEKVSEDGENDRLRYGLSSMQGWRSSMEDAHAAIPDLDNSTSFFAVYDGHGGKAVAKFCAKFLRKELLTDEAYLAGDLSTSLRRVFLRMDEMINSNRNWRELLWDDIETDSGFDDEFYFASGETEQEADEGLAKEEDDSDLEGPCSGCTACAVIIRDNKLIVANAGDSRCVLSKGGQAVELSRDHKPELEGEQERILKAGGFIHEGRVNGTLNLARAIGIQSGPTICRRYGVQA